MSPDVLQTLAAHVTDIVLTLLGALITMYVVPWLKDKKLYDAVKIAVSAAEKWAETHPINKREWVEEQLTKNGIPVTDKISVMIEGAVEELDAALGKHKNKAQNG